MRELNLDPVTRITTGAQGEPGQRTFYIQARKDDQVVSLLVEKQQVEELARHIDSLLLRLQQRQPRDAETEPTGTDLELEEPLDPEFRVGPMALGYDADRDLVLLQCEELVQPPDAEEDESVEGELRRLVEGEQPKGAVARFWATREQMRALARHGAEVAAAGRPRCPLCGNPLDPGVHVCPALNGHRELQS